MDGKISVNFIGGAKCEILSPCPLSGVVRWPLEAGAWLEKRKGAGYMAAMKPRTGDGPMEVTKEARSLVMRIPLEGGGRLVVELNGEEASNLGSALHAAAALLVKK